MGGIGSEDSPEPTHVPHASGRARLALYATLLAVLAGVCCFYRLSEGTLFGDEATFAYTTDRMRATGDRVVPYLAGVPHLNATPLYNWLNLTTLPEVGAAPLDYRLWSAAFGAGCVLLTFVLGVRLFNPEVGLLAGLLLVFNRDFLFCHCARFCGMDAMLAFFLTGAVLCHARIRQGGARESVLWALMGACVGLAWLSKPPVFGTCFFGLILVQHVWSRRNEGPRAWAAGPLLALAVATGVAAPWYVLVWSRLGPGALHALFVHNSVERALDPVGRDFLCCVKGIDHASGGFKLVFPALAAAGACWVVDHRRGAWGLILVVAGGFLLALTAAGKAGNYIFYAFPMLAVLVAGALLDGVPRLAAGWRPGLRRAAVLGGAAVAVGAVAYDANKAVRALFDPPWIHPPVGLYERLTPDVESGRCHFVLVLFPPPDNTFAPGRSCYLEDMYYSTRMPLADRITDPEELRRLVATGEPVVVVCPPAPEARLPADLVPVLTAKGRSPVYGYPVFVFNGLPGELTAPEVTRLAGGNQP